MNTYSCTKCGNYPAQSKDAEPLVVDKHGAAVMGLYGKLWRMSPVCPVYARCFGSSEWLRQTALVPPMWNVRGE